MPQPRQPVNIDQVEQVQRLPLHPQQSLGFPEHPPQPIHSNVWSGMRLTSSTAATGRVQRQESSRP
jgi:hypothetical protein